MVNEIRRTINPPYRAKDLISIFLALFILLSIPITVIQVYSQRNTEASASNPEPNLIQNIDDAQAPSISFTSPKDSAYIAGYSYQVELAASDDVFVKQVDVEVDGNKVATLTSDPYIYSWNLTSIKPGNHTIKATAYDGVGNSESTSISVYRGVKQLAN